MLSSLLLHPPPLIHTHQAQDRSSLIVARGWTFTCRNFTCSKDRLWISEHGLRGEHERKRKVTWRKKKKERSEKDREGRGKSCKQLQDKQENFNITRSCLTDCKYKHASKSKKKFQVLTSHDTSQNPAQPRSWFRPRPLLLRPLHDSKPREILQPRDPITMRD